MQPKPYKICLKQLIAECEANYWRLLKLLPEQQTYRHYTVLLAHHQQAELILQLEQQCAYTRMIRLTQTVKHQPWQWQLDIRLYQDAKLAEVVSCQKQRQVQARYDYPNQKMYQSDEKYQQNRLLSELLSHCLAHGFSAAEQTIV